MTTKAAFNAEDWSVVANAPFLTAMLVIAADRGGTVRETMAISRAYAAAREQGGGELLQAVLLTPPAIDPATAPRTPRTFVAKRPPRCAKRSGSSSVMPPRTRWWPTSASCSRCRQRRARPPRGRLPRTRRDRDQRARAGGARRDRRDLRRAAERLTHARNQVHIGPLLLAVAGGDEHRHEVLASPWKRTRCGPGAIRSSLSDRPAATARFCRRCLPHGFPFSEATTAPRAAAPTRRVDETQPDRR